MTRVTASRASHARLIIVVTVYLISRQDRSGAGSLVGSPHRARARGKHEGAAAHEHSGPVSRQRHEHGTRKCRALLSFAPGHTLGHTFPANGRVRSILRASSFRVFSRSLDLPGGEETDILSSSPRRSFLLSHELQCRIGDSSRPPASLVCIVLWPLPQSPFIIHRRCIDTHKQRSRGRRRR